MTLRVYYEGEEYVDSSAEVQFSVYLSVSCKLATLSNNYDFSPVVYKMNGEAKEISGINKDIYSVSLFNNMYPETESLLWLGLLHHPRLILQSLSHFKLAKVLFRMAKPRTNSHLPPESHCSHEGALIALPVVRSLGRERVNGKEGASTTNASQVSNETRGIAPSIRNEEGK